MQNFKLTIAYDGTNYAGWQRQKNAPSVQETIEKVLQRILQQKIRLTGASRTDSGAHAVGQAANFIYRGRPMCLPKNRTDPRPCREAGTRVRPYAEILLKGLNGLLPRDIRVLKIEEVPLKFHSQFDAKKKLYRYTIVTSPEVLPQERFFGYHYPYSLNVTVMRRAAKILVGTHDFASFQGSDPKRKSRNTRRKISRFRVIHKKDRLIFELEANGFLYTMVRTIIGTLLEVGRGKRPWGSIRQVLKKRDRTFAGPTLPAKGLCLLKVSY